MRVREVSPSEVRGVLWPPLIDLNLQIFGSYDGRVPFAEVLLDHLSYPGFRAFIVPHPDGRLAGYAYGYTSAPSQWWHDQVAAYLDDAGRRRWLGDAFEVASLGLLPEVRGQGLGTRLLAQLLDGLPHATAVLTVATANAAGQRLYRGRGWQVIVEDFRFEAHPEPYQVMGLEFSRDDP